MSPPKRPRLGTHNRSWIWGRHTVLEMLRAGMWLPHELLVSSRCADDIRREIMQLSERRGVEPIEADDALISRRCRVEDHQGVAAEMPPFPYASLANLLSRTPPLVRWLILDRLQDSFNFGAIVRTAVALGIDALVIGSTEQSEVNSQVARSSAGAVNWIPIARVPRLIEAVQSLRQRGVHILAATEKGTQSIDQTNWGDRSAVIIGNEGRGIQADILRECDQQVRIPMPGRIASLNAAVAAGIICYEMTRQRASTL